MSKIKQKQEMFAKQDTDISFEELSNAKGNMPKHSGFEAPTYGIVYPKGTKFRIMSDGIMKPIIP